MGKMYYTEAEAAEKLNISAEEIQQLVADGKLSEYADGAQKMYKAEDVEALALAALAEGAEGAGEVELAPAGSTADGDVVTLSEADKDAQQAGKSDTVLTSEGISVFDDEDLEVGAGDPMAKTTITPGAGEDISLEGVGSGSGLLDLTRESDDTSLGEVLEHIDVESVIPSSPPVELAEEAAPEVEAVAPEVPMVAEELDAATGAFSGLIVAAGVVMLFASLAAMAVLLGEAPSYLYSLQNNLPLWLLAAVVVGGVLTLVGYFIGKTAATKAVGLQRGG